MIEDFMNKEIQICLKSATDGDLLALAKILEKTGYKIWCGGNMYSGLLTTKRKYNYLYFTKNVFHASIYDDSIKRPVVQLKDFLNGSRKIKKIETDEIDELFGEV